MSDDNPQLLGGAVHRLATYGTFPPGGSNHHVVESLGGSWTRGYLEGHTRAARAGRWTGYIGFEPEPGGPRIPAWLLESDALPGAWAMLDDFEGPAFPRRIVGFHLEDRRRVAAHVYVLDDGDGVPKT
ncbi:MAG: gamma-glutamylcyclotransferase family protein [Pseudomonadota bacterium]